MPNHVYHHITASTEEGTEILKAMAKNPHGLCGYLLPMPEDLQGTTSPQRIPETISRDEHDRLVEKYGCADWHTWANRNWGTKWGCYDNEFDGDQYTFTTAWGTFSNTILAKLLEVIPSLQMTWEEEQGFGEDLEFEDGEQTYYLEWSKPDWSHHIEYNGEDVYFLEADHTNPMGAFPSGYYVDQDFHKPIENEDLVKKLNELSLDEE